MTLQAAISPAPEPDVPAYLGVECSVSGRRWQESPSDDRLAQALSQRLGLPEVVGRVLSMRGIGLEDAETFLSPTVRDLLPNPSLFQDMDKAAARIAKAVMSGEAIGILGDYDVDGATSSALLKTFLQAVGATVTVHIPDRVSEGYGPNLPALQRLQGKGVRLVVTVDCGTTAFEVLQGAQDMGLDVIVVDHHEAEPELPAAVAVVNPKRLDDTSNCTYLAAVGVVFVLVVAINRELSNRGWAEAKPSSYLMRWLDLVALGTVCDVVPLRGLNRALVSQGLKVLAKRENLGLAALADVAKMRERPDSYHLGYVLGPRLNAGGRVGESALGSRLLSAETADEAIELAQRLNEYNRERQDIEAEVARNVVDQVERSGIADAPLLLLAGDGWHQGVIGIVAGRLKERYNRPTCVVALDGDVGKGSGRSVPGFDLGSAIIAARQAGLLLAGGGHAMAAGFSVARDRVEDLHRFLCEQMHIQQTTALVPMLHLDGVLDCAGCTLELLDHLRCLGPFGAGNPQPRFAIPRVRIAYADVVGNAHVRCTLVGHGGHRLKAVAFRSVDGDLGRTLLNHNGAVFHIAGTLHLDSWKGANSVQLFIDDAALVTDSRTTRA